MSGFLKEGFCRQAILLLSGISLGRQMSQQEVGLGVVPLSGHPEVFHANANTDIAVSNVASVVVVFASVVFIMDSVVKVASQAALLPEEAEVDRRVEHSFYTT